MKSASLLAISLLVVSRFPATESKAGQPTTAAKSVADAADKNLFTNSIGMRFVLIPAGKFRMGSPGTVEDRRDDEDEVDVTLTKLFYLGKTEVTQKQWRSVMETRPWKGERYIREGDDYPAVCVSYADAQEFCKKLSEKNQTVYRLPSEAEWECACRGKTTTQFSVGDDDSRLGEYAWYGGLTGEGSAKSEHYAHAVATRKPNAFGLYDMHGNVGEWCADWYWYYPKSAVDDPTGPSKGKYRVHRGGAWNVLPSACRSAARGGSIPSTRVADLGFRVATSFEPAKVAVGVGVTSPVIPAAAEPASDSTLSWQFKPGQMLRWTLDQSVQLRAPQEGKITEANMKQIVDFDVRIASVKQGIAELKVSTSRVRAEMELPDGKMKYDSNVRNADSQRKGTDTRKSDGAEPEALKLGQELLAAMLAPVLDLKFSVTVDKQCAVEVIEIDDEKRQALMLVRPLQSFMTVFDEAGFSSGYLGGFVRLPSGKFPSGEAWISKVVSPNASGVFGKLQFEHEFRTDGNVTVDGEELQKFSANVQMTLEGAGNGLVKLGKQTGEGILYFDAKRGRVRSSEWNLTAQILFGGTDAEGQMKMKTTSEIHEMEE